MKTWKIALVVVGAMALVVGVAKLLAEQGNDPHPSELPAWIEAIATLAAFGAATAAALLVARTVTIELQRESDRLEVDRRGQASLVAAWAVGPRYATGDLDQDTLRYPVTGVSSVTVKVRNASPIPVSDAVVTVSARVQSPGDPADGPESRVVRATESIGLIEPESTEVIGVPFDPPVPIAEKEHFDQIEVFMSFRDASGVWWVRDGEGLYRN